MCIMYFIAKAAGKGMPVMGLMLLWSAVGAFNVDTKFPVIYSGSPGSYFGYTVALHQNKKGSFALVGAPRENSRYFQAHQPGVLFSCNIPKNASLALCGEIMLDNSGNNITGNGQEFSYHDRKDDMWLGISLDIQQNSVNDIVTCGHLWRNQLYKNYHLANGVCYVINSDLEPKTVKKLLPLIQKSKQFISYADYGIFYYALGQAGTSAVYSEDGKHLLLGAPGFYDWIGTVVSYSSDPNNIYKYKNPSVPDPPRGLSSESYLGYSVTSGKFFDNNEMYYAAGAPKDNRKYGQVHIFKISEQRKYQLSIQHTKKGTQFSEYFGATVSAINVNGDAYTDLLVGAPFYSTEYGGDEGKVYVYLSNGVGLQLYAELLGDTQPYSRFGTAIADVGDLNQDGFKDVAIGAPYEDGNGAIYIYHGSDAGIIVPYIQKIKAADVSPGLSGFGIHISRGLDIDKNKYPDILVGSFSSANAVLFRTRPVIHLVPKLVFNPPQINPNLTMCEYEGEKLRCVNVSACLWYTGIHVPLSLDFTYDVFVEPPNLINPISPRGFFVVNGKQASKISQEARLDIGSYTCMRHVLYIYPDIKDVITPIEALFGYRLGKPAHEHQNFKKSIPVIDPSSLTNITSAITFQTGCSNENQCLSDLSVTAVMLGSDENGQILLGEVSSVWLEITVKNKGDPAYLSELHIFLPPNIQSIKQDFCVSPNQRNNISLVCDLGNPLLDDRQVQIKLDVTKVPIHRRKIDIHFEALTLSTDTRPEDNTFTVSLQFQAISDIGITGTSSQEQLLYDEDLGVPLFISHTYTVRNHGPSPLHVIDIALRVPIAFANSADQKPFLTFTGLEADGGKRLTIPAQCNSTNLNIKRIVTEGDIRGLAPGEDGLVIQGKNATDLKEERGQPRRDLKEKTTGIRSKRSTKESKTKAKTREVAVISCARKNVKCVTILCSASPFWDTRKVAQITVSAQVNLTTMGEYLGSWYQVELVTVGEITMRDTDTEKRYHHPDVAQVKTLFLYKGPPPAEELAAWIIFVSIGVGVLLLLIILVLLIRFGFFRRRQKEKMNELLEAENKDIDPLVEDQKETGTSDKHLGGEETEN